MGQMDAQLEFAGWETLTAKIETGTSRIGKMARESDGKRPPSLLRYPGGKSRLAQTICERLMSILPEADIYYEPFFGGGSVGIRLLDSYGLFVRQAYVSDADPCVAALWTTVITQPEKLKQMVLNFQPSVAAFYLFKNSSIGIESVPNDEQALLETGFRKLALHRISFSGLGEMSGAPLGGKGQGCDGTIGSRWNSERICEAINRTHEILESKAVGRKCHHADFRQALSAATKNDLVYLDPPYYEQGPALYKRSFSHQDHNELAQLLRSAKCRWLLSYDDCEEIRELYAWANVEALPVRNTLSQRRQEGKFMAKSQNELLISSLA